MCPHHVIGTGPGQVALSVLELIDHMPLLRSAGNKGCATMPHLISCFLWDPIPLSLRDHCSNFSPSLWLQWTSGRVCLHNCFLFLIKLLCVHTAESGWGWGRLQRWGTAMSFTSMSWRSLSYGVGVLPLLQVVPSDKWHRVKQKAWSGPPGSGGFLGHSGYCPVCEDWLGFLFRLSLHPNCSSPAKSLCQPLFVMLITI